MILKVNGFLIVLTILSCDLYRKDNLHNQKGNQAPSDIDTFICSNSGYLSDSLYCIREDGYEGVILGTRLQCGVLERAAIENITYDSIWFPTQVDIHALESLFEGVYQKSIKPTLTLMSKDTVVLSRYLRQYVGVYTLLGEKSILVGYTRVSSKVDFHQFYYEHYLKKFMRWNDGEGRFFMLKYDIKNKKYYDIVI